MKIDRLILGDFETNCYVVRADESARDCVVIDTGLDSREMMAFLAEHRLTPAAVILTHGHVDHIAGLAALRSAFPQVRVYIHKLDGPMLTDSRSNLSRMAMMPFTTAAADVLLADGDTIDEAGIVLKVLHTPGHTPGGICLYAESEGVVFAGDTLFAGGIGRTDFPGGDTEQLLDSIRAKLFVLPDPTAVHPGHAMRTTIGREKASNPFLTPNP
ncbi:MBL fold metallo-hydrolase [Anaerobaca lacustris]|uniref:MBL fold metallo-hydrolase n=1 Tax=Anaerobaca lacustris TaxID=3044600 RepID=A0AAW6TZ25_9BACT|nr:MBL fold metallo-hydrolase [Sedimentisphaerales bacterium M17dextr]